jgi:signal transduction histidine kinase
MIIRGAPSELLAGALPAGRRRRPSADVLSRFPAPVHSRQFFVALAAAAVAAEIAVLAPVVLGTESAPGYRIAFRLVGGAFVACGIVAWRRRPDSLSGALMVATGFGLFVEPIFAQFDPAALRALGDMFEDVWGIFIVALLLTILTGGRLVSTVDRVLVGAFVAILGLELARHLFLEEPGNFLLVHPDDGLADAVNTVILWLTSVACLAVAVVIGARWKAASRPGRRALLPSVAGIASLLFFAVAQQADPLLLRWLAVCSLLIVPAAFLAGLLRSRLARGALTELLRDPGAIRGAVLQERVAGALGDPGAVLARRLDGGEVYADAEGNRVEPPPPGGGRSALTIERDGEPVALLCYDAALDDDPELVQAVAATAGIALDNERLQLEAQERLTELQASRQRIVAAGDAERRRLERDLHDGAQQRLVALAMQLRLIQADIRRDPEAAEALVEAAGDELSQSLAELRELARGLHPAVLDHGLPTALESLAARSAVPTAVVCEAPPQLAPEIELALYFVACEALTNIAKYAGASTASVRLARSDGGVVIEVADDGAGGAVAGGGSGLRGLADRVEALDGRLLVVSPPGAGTVVSAELPCGS